MLNLRDLSCFMAVYELRSFGRSAERLDMAQSLVSARILRLEEFIGAPLFLRSHRGAQPTRKGELLYRHAQRILHEVAALESAVKSSDAA